MPGSFPWFPPGTSAMPSRACSSYGFSAGPEGKGPVARCAPGCSSIPAQNSVSPLGMSRITQPFAFGFFPGSLGLGRIRFCSLRPPTLLEYNTTMWLMRELDLSVPGRGLSIAMKGWGSLDTRVCFFLYFTIKRELLLNSSMSVCPPWDSFFEDHKGLGL